MFVNAKVKHQDRAICYLKTLSYFITTYVAVSMLTILYTHISFFFHNISFQIIFLFSLGIWESLM